MTERFKFRAKLAMVVDAPVEDDRDRTLITNPFSDHRLRAICKVDDTESMMDHCNIKHRTISKRYPCPPDIASIGPAA